jgi:hypothetical protein
MSRNPIDTKMVYTPNEIAKIFLQANVAIDDVVILARQYYSAPEDKEVIKETERVASHMQHLLKDFGLFMSKTIKGERGSSNKNIAVN